MRRAHQRLTASRASCLLFISWRMPGFTVSPSKGASAEARSLGALQQSERGSLRESRPERRVRSQESSLSVMRFLRSSLRYRVRRSRPSRRAAFVLLPSTLLSTFWMYSS